MAAEPTMMIFAVQAASRNASRRWCVPMALICSGVTGSVRDLPASASTRAVVHDRGLQPADRVTHGDAVEQVDIEPIDSGIARQRSGAAGACPRVDRRLALEEPIEKVAAGESRRRR